MKKSAGRSRKRLVAVLLCMALLLVNVMPVFAEETDPDATVTGQDENKGTEENTEEVSETTEEEDSEESTDPVDGGIMLLGVEDLLNSGVNVIKEGAEGVTFDIDDGKCVMIDGTTSGDPIVFKNCTFNLSGSTMLINGDQGVNYHRGETITKLWIGDNVQFDNCTFIAKNGKKSTTAGYDACIYFFSGDIVLNRCTLSATGYEGQFLGLYGKTGSVTFNGSKLSTVGNVGAWSYAMYSTSKLVLDDSRMTATGTVKPASGNTNVFYTGDNSLNEVEIKNKTKVDFHDNASGGFVFNNTTVTVTDSEIYVNDNLGNACNSGYWEVDNSTITMNGNRGGHALSCIGANMKDSRLEILHNGYAGLYIQSKDSVFTNCTVDIRCNGENLASYSAGDVWLNTHKITFNNCDHVWLGGVGRKGEIVNNNCKYFVAYDLYECKFKGNTAQILGGVKISEQDEHTLFLNSKVDFDYARSDINDNSDRDLFADLTKEVATGKDTAKIGKLTTAQLSHHMYDWENGEITDQASPDYYGVIKYNCIDSCKDYIDRTKEHKYGLNCQGTSVYAPLVGLTFEAGAEDVTNMPEAQTEIPYEGNGTEPEAPVREGYVFTGWYTDKECTEKFDFSSGLTDNWTVVYAGWEKAPEQKPADTSKPDITKTDKASKEVETGDANHIALIIVIMGLAAITALVAVKRRERY